MTVGVTVADMLKPNLAAIASVEQTAELQPVAWSDLVPFETSKEAKRLALLEADKDLYARLMLRGYEGPEYDDFARALVEYALPVLRAWIISGMVFVQCQRRGFGGLPRFVAKIPWSECRDLATDTIVNSLDAFRRKVLIPARWDPTKGASLKTFFVGQCVLQFPNVYRSWFVRAVRALPLADPVQVDEMISREPSPDTGAILSETVGRLAPDSTTLIEAARRLGFKNAEIAEILSTTEKAVEMRLARHRKKEKEKKQ